MTTTIDSRQAQSRKIRLMALTGLFMAMIYVLTAFFHVPTTKGYIHVGDGLIFLAASVLPAPYAICAASVGAALSDALSGYWIWVPATLIIKGLTAFCFTSKSEKLLCRRNLIALVPALVLCVAGYGLYSGFIIYGSLAAGFVDALPNMIQTGASAVVYVILAGTLEKTKLSTKIKRLAEIRV